MKLIKTKTGELVVQVRDLHEIAIDQLQRKLLSDPDKLSRLLHKAQQDGRYPTPGRHS